MFVTGPRFFSNYKGMTIRYEEAIERAQTIVPVAKRNIAAAEELRRMPEENIKAILESGLMPLMRPTFRSVIPPPGMTMIRSSTGMIGVESSWMARCWTAMISACSRACSAAACCWAVTSRKLQTRPTI